MGKKHHHIPRFLLQDFTDAEGYIWALDKQTGKIFSTKPENIACKNYLYSIGGRQNNALEEDFAKLEGEAKPVIDKIILNWKLPETREDKGLLLYFLCHLIYRALDMVALASNKGLVLEALKADYIKAMKQRPVKDFIDEKKAVNAILETDNLIYAESFGEIVRLLAKYVNENFNAFL